MVNIEDIRKTTYTSSKKMARFINKVDRKITKAAASGWDSVEIGCPNSMSEDVFRTVMIEYKNKGFEVSFRRREYSFYNIPCSSFLYVNISWNRKGEKV